MLIILIYCNVLSRKYQIPTSVPIQTRPQPTPKKKPNVTLKDALDKLYEDIESAPSYSAKIEKYLRSNIVHSRHRRIIKKVFPRRRVILEHFVFGFLLNAHSLSEDEEEGKEKEFHCVGKFVFCLLIIRSPAEALF